MVLDIVNIGYYINVRQTRGVRMKFNDVFTEERYKAHQLWIETDRKKGERLDLSGANLRDAKLCDSNLKFANLSGADLSDTNLRRADLSGANLSGANLFGADLADANLRGANLSNANLTDANLSYADLHNADLYRADLSGANLSYADLHNADLRRADLRGANLFGANMMGTNIGFACWPLRCSSFDVKVDKRIAVQFLYHYCRMDCNSFIIKATQWLLKPLANKFHRVGIDVDKL
jgi:uncharacterized protein YjbI with pentapeptide repeats